MDLLIETFVQWLCFGFVNAFLVRKVFFRSLVKVESNKLSLRSRIEENSGKFSGCLFTDHFRYINIQHGSEAWRKLNDYVYSFLLCPLEPRLHGSGQTFARKKTSTTPPCVYTGQANFWAPCMRARTNFCTNKPLHGFSLRLHETGGTGRIFEQLSM